MHRCATSALTVSTLRSLIWEVRFYCSVTRTRSRRGGSCSGAYWHNCTSVLLTSRATANAKACRAGQLLPTGGPGRKGCRGDPPVTARNPKGAHVARFTFAAYAPSPPFIKSPPPVLFGQRRRGDSVHAAIRQQALRNNVNSRICCGARAARIHWLRSWRSPSGHARSPHA